MPEVHESAGLIAERFRRLRSADRCAFIPYVTAGYPDPESTRAVLRMLIDEGADLIELGVPFSDPLADGPTIQRASWQALSRGVDLRAVLNWCQELGRDDSIPLVLFSYLNPILRYGPERFAREARRCGAAGVLVTDLPTGADRDLERTITSAGLDLVRLIAPTTSPQRAASIARSASGFLYYISRPGVTGEREELRHELADEVARLRELTDLPVAVGFGVSTPDHARTVATVADGVVVGSALVRALGEGGVARARALARELRAAIDAA